MFQNFHQCIARLVVWIDLQPVLWTKDSLKKIFCRQKLPYFSYLTVSITNFYWSLVCLSSWPDNDHYVVLLQRTGQVQVLYLIIILNIRWPWKTWPMTYTHTCSASMKNIYCFHCPVCSFLPSLSHLANEFCCAQVLQYLKLNTNQGAFPK